MLLVTHIQYMYIHVSWLAYHPSSQGWAPECPLGSILYVYFVVWCPGCDYLSFFPIYTFLASVLRMHIHVHVIILYFHVSHLATIKFLACRFCCFLIWPCHITTGGGRVRERGRRRRRRGRGQHLMPPGVHVHIYIM